MPPRHFVDPMPHHPLILLPIDPACPLDVVKCTPDVLEQHTHKPVHFKVEDSSPLSYMCHAPLCHPTTSVTHTLTISCPISLIFRSIDTSPRISPENPHDCESDCANIVNEPSFIPSLHACSTPRAAPISPPISPPHRMNDHRHRCYQSSPHARRSDRRNVVSKPISAVAPLPRISTHSAPASHSIIISRRTNSAVDCSYPSSHHAHKSDHGEVNYDLNGAAVPRVPAASSPATHTTVYKIPAHHKCTTEVVAKFPALQATAQGISKEIQGDFGELPVVGESSVTCDHCGIVLSPPPAMHIPIALPVPLSLPTPPLTADD